MRKLSTRTLYLWCVATIAVVSCRDQTGPLSTAAPSSVTTAPPTSTVTVSGRVVDRLSGHPLAGVQVAVFPKGSWTFLSARGPSDADGRFTVSLPSSSPAAWLVVNPWMTTQLVQQCASFVTADGYDTVQDVRIVSTTDLAAANSTVPTSSPGQRTVSGMVFATTGDGRQPLAGALIGWDTGESVNDQIVDVAWTQAAGDGRFLLCGLPTTEGVLDAFTSDFRGHVRVAVPAGPDARVDIDVSTGP
jgi:hypothetical protein